MPDVAQILIVDDDQAVRDLLLESLAEAYRCASAADGVEALELLRHGDFDLVISDIDMPRMDGVCLLQEVKRALPEVEVIMLTGVLDVEIAIQSMRLGAADYLTKPFNLAEVAITIDRALERRRLVRENRAYQKDLEARVRQRTAELSHKGREIEDLFARLTSAYRMTLEALATALDSRDSETMGHSLRVAAYTVAVARRMGVSEPELTDIYRGALLHDVGKIGIPDAILRKPGKLTREEWVEMRRHPGIGYRILEGIRFLEGPSRIVLCHQERWDGGGYPRGLGGQEIPLGARIFAVVDTLDAMTSDRCYRKALAYQVARREIIKYRGAQFDPAVVDVFLTIPEEEWESIRQRVLEEVAARQHHDRPEDRAEDEATRLAVGS